MRDTSGDMFITSWMSRVTSAMCGWCLPQARNSSNIKHHVVKTGLGVERNPMDLASPVPLYFENDLDVDPEEDELDSMDMVFYDTKVDYYPKNSKTLTIIEKENNNNLKSPVIIKSPMGSNSFRNDNSNLNIIKPMENEKYQSSYYEIDNAELNEINTNNLNSLTFSQKCHRPTHLDLGANVYRPSMSMASDTNGYPHCYAREVDMDMDEDRRNACDNRDYITDYRGTDSTMFNMLRTFRCFEGVETPHLNQQFLPMEVRRPPGKIPTTHLDGYAPINQMSAIIY